MSGSYQPPIMVVNTMPSIHRVLPRPLPPNTSTFLLHHQLIRILHQNHLLRSIHQSGSTIFATSYLGRPSLQVDLGHFLAPLLPKTVVQHLPPCLRVAGSTRTFQHIADHLNQTNTLSSKLPITPSDCSVSLAVLRSLAPRLPRLKPAEVNLVLG